MRGDRAGAVLVAGFLFIAVPGLRAAPDPAAADAAFDAGDSARALALYDEVLAADPNDVNALLRSGKLLSWDRKYAAALARYDRALAREPQNTAVLLERAKVLLWSQRYDEAVPAFDRVLRQAPTEPWALCGMAQAYAWRGRGREARPYYERALSAEPGMKEAMLGLAYLDLADGDTTKARERAGTLTAAHPDDPEVIELSKQVKRARAPWVQVGWDGADDSDENGMKNYRVEGGFALPARLDLRFGYTHSDLRGLVPPAGEVDAQADALFGVLGWQPRAGHRGELRAGAMRQSDDLGFERTAGLYGLSYSFPMAGWNGRAAVARDPFLYSPQILGNAIDITSLTFGAWGKAAPRVRVETNAGFADFSDGNARLSADAGAWYVWAWSKRSVSLGGVVRFADYSDDLDHGYFDPQNWIAAVVSLRSEGSIGASAWSYETAAEVGSQSFTLGGVDASGELLWTVHALVARPLPHGFSFHVFADFGNSSAASGPGYRSRSGGFRVRFTIGG